MTSLDMLREALKALNSIPNRKYVGNYKDTYELCGAIEKYIRNLTTEPKDAFSSKMFTQLKFEYAKEEKMANNDLKVL